MKVAVRALQRAYRAHYYAGIQTKMATAIQARWRSHSASVAYGATRGLAGRLQRLQRGRAARKVYTREYSARQLQ